MQKSSTRFHAKRSSGRNVRGVDYCAFTHLVVNDRSHQFMANSLLTGLLNRLEVA